MEYHLINNGDTSFSVTDENGDHAGGPYLNTGKVSGEEKAKRRIRDLKRRASQPLVEVNVAAEKERAAADELAVETMTEADLIAGLLPNPVIVAYDNATRIASIIPDKSIIPDGMVAVGNPIVGHAFGTKPEILPPSAAQNPINDPASGSYAFHRQVGCYPAISKHAYRR